MYLKERIISVFTYMFILLFFCFIISNKTTNKNKIKHFLLMYNIILAILAFFYIPQPSADLYRLFINMHNYSSYSLSEITNIATNSSVPVAIYYLYFISKIGIDGLLPAITSFVFHGCIFSIFYRAYVKFNISNKNLALGLLFFMEMGKFLEVISGIRALMSFSIICYCIYREIVDNDSMIKHIPLYIISIFLHQAALTLSILRIAFLLFQKETRVVDKIRNYIIILIMIITSLYFSNSFLNSMIEKANYYLGTKVYSYFWEYLISWLTILFSTYMLLKFKKIIRKNKLIFYYSKFIYFLLIIIVIFNFEYSIFSRFTTSFSILFTPIFMYVINDIERDKYKYKMFNFVLITYIFIIFIIAGVRGNLSAFKFFIY